MGPPLRNRSQDATPWLSGARRAVLLLAVLANCLTAGAQDAAPLVRMLKSGRLPPERIGSVLELVCQRGSAEDLAYVFSQLARADAIPRDARLQGLAALAAAAETRKIVPEFDAAALRALCGDGSEPLQLAAVRLAGAWQAQNVAPVLQELVAGAVTAPSVRRAAIHALARIGGDAARDTATRLIESGDVSGRLLGIDTMAQLDLDRAAAAAAEMLRQGAAGDQTGELLGPFLKIQGGSDKLAAELSSSRIAADLAKLALRHLYAAGRSDAALVEVLSRAAGLTSTPPALDAGQLKSLSAEVLAKGDPHRGEQVFRRADLSCMKCHAVSGAGGDIGPDLSPVGSTSPPDYLITSILNPDLSIKENFLTRSFVTDAGRIYQGIVADRDEKRVVLKEATGERVTIPVADIVDEVEGKSLMPTGLAGFLSHQEFLDLVRFLSLLGKPGEYEIRSRPTVQRWRVLIELPAELATEAPASAPLHSSLAALPDSAWKPVYAQVAGVLPLDEVAQAVAQSNPPSVIYLRADLALTSPGEIESQFDDVRGIAAWIDDQPLQLRSPTLATLAAGPHQLFLRVDRAERGNAALRVLVDKASGSAAAVVIVGGK